MRTRLALNPIGKALLQEVYASLTDVCAVGPAAVTKLFYHSEGIVKTCFVSPVCGSVL